MTSVIRSPSAVSLTADHMTPANGGAVLAGVEIKGFDRLSNELRRLLRVVEADYGYGQDHLAHQAKAHTLSVSARKPVPNALSFDVLPGFPFLLAVALTEAPSAAHRESAIRHALDTATISTILLYDVATESREILRRDFREDRFDTASGLSSCHQPHQPRMSGQPSLFDHSANEDRTKQATQLPITNKLEGLFFEMHSIMRDEDGLHADEALEELCKLLHLKTSIELSNAPVSTAALRSFEEASALLRGLYLRSCDTNVPQPWTAKHPYLQPIGLSTTALVKAFGLLESHTLTGTDTDVKGRAFQKVLTKAARAGMGQYFTPAPVVSMMVEIIDPTLSEFIIDPFCGSGHFLTQSLLRLRNDMGEDACRRYASRQLHGIEKSERMARVAITEMSLSGCPGTNIRTVDALLDFDNYQDIRPSSFDIVLTNPPFGSILGVQAFSSLAKFKLAKGRKRLPLEVAGLERCADLLRPGGRLAIVLPESIFSAASSKHVRAWLQRVFSIRVVVDLPPETFCPFGANVRSGILFARKRRDGECVDSEERVGMIRVDNVGYDASGRPRAEGDIELAVNEAKRFLAAEGW